MPRRAYTVDDLAVIFLTRKSRRNNQDLAALFDRSPSAIDWIWRSFTCGGGIGPRPSLRLTEQVETVTARFGGAAFQSCQTVVEALDRVYPPEQGAA